jgi:hypothetical protein
MHLSSHPDIWVPPFKEIHFFDHKFIPDNRRWSLWHVHKAVEKAIYKEQNMPTIDDVKIKYLGSLLQKPLLNGTWYKRIYERCPPHLTGIDITPAYSSLPPEGIEFMARFLGPDVKIVYLIRDPVERALSQIRMNVSRNGMIKSDVDWIKEASKSVVFDRGNYSRNISNWDNSSLKDNVLYCSFRDIKAKPEKLLSSVENFSGLREWKYKRVAEKVHATKSINIPASVSTFLCDMMQPQYKFIEDRFGNNFL